MTLRAVLDLGAYFLPESRHRMEKVPKRNLIGELVEVSDAASLRSRDEPSIEAVLPGAHLSQAHAGMAGTANARASGWNRPPIDRMANLNVEPGASTLDTAARASPTRRSTAATPRRHASSRRWTCSAAKRGKLLRKHVFSRGACADPAGHFRRVRQYVQGIDRGAGGIGSAAGGAGTHDCRAARRLDAGERKFLLSLARNEPSWALLGIEHLDELPGIRWKLMNLERLAKANPKKLEAQARDLEKLLFK